MLLFYNGWPDFFVSRFTVKTSTISQSAYKTKFDRAHLLASLSTQTLHDVQLPFYLRSVFGFASNAYAVDGFSTDPNQCQIPIANDEYGAITAGEMMMKTLIDCYLKDKVEETLIRVDTAVGFQ
jgi:hypothetical protein